MKRGNSVLKIILSILIVIIVIVSTFFLSISKKYNNCLSAIKSYFLCVKVNTLINNINEESNRIKRLGGAGKILNYNNFEYIVLSVYNEFSDANLVKKQVISSCPNVEIITISSKSIPFNIKRKIQNNQQIYIIFNGIYNFFANFCKYQKLYLSSEITQSKFLSNILSQKFQFENSVNNINKFFIESIFFKTISDYSNLLVLEINNFITNFYGSENKSHVIFLFATEFMLSRIDFFNCL